tara:strand:+ start:491 stop:937 length:447 start_codon:yes stop_codon:yes gene_type:complete
MNLLIKLFSCLLLLFAIGCGNLAFAGDIVPAGTTLQEESYVFSVDEATRLLQRIEELEIKEQQLDEYIQLDLINQQKIDLYSANVDLYNFQISEYQRIIALNTLEIDRMHKRARFNWLENYGMLFLGAALTTASFIVADRITDDVMSR